MKVYITKANAKRIINELNHNKYYEDDIDFFKRFSWFSYRDKSEIVATALLYKDINSLTKTYQGIKNNQNQNTYVYNSQSCYHFYTDCERLKSDFINFIIPNEIKDKGSDVIQKFKLFFKDNNALLEEKPDVFNERLRFNILPEKVWYSNSGIANKHCSLNDLKLKVNELPKLSHEFYNSSNEIKIILDNFGEFSFIWKTKRPPNNNYISFSNEEIWEVLEEFDEKYKTPYKECIIEFLRLTHNKDLAFESNKLDEFGFRPCSQCNAKKLAEDFKFV